MSDYFSEKEEGKQSQILKKIDAIGWQGIFTIIENRIDDGSLGYKFPARCDDNDAVIGTHNIRFWNQVRAEIPDLSECLSKEIWEDEALCWPPSGRNLPPTLAILDFIEFVAKNLAKPTKESYHSFFSHHHLEFDEEEGLFLFRKDINLIFSRQRLAYKVTKRGKIKRCIPSPVKKMINSGEIQTGDNDLDELLNQSIEFYLSPDPKDKQHALEKLWDAFERLKTIEKGKNKKEQAEALLQSVKVKSEKTFHQMIEDEFRCLTEAGNSLRIRHSETNQEKMETNEQKDYLFIRMFSVIHFILVRTERIK